MALSQNYKLEVKVFRSFNERLMNLLGASFEKESSEYVTMKNAYHKVESLNGDKNCISFDLAIFEETKKEMAVLKKYSFVPSMGNENFVKQAYDHLKTLPEFAGAIDC
jgi:activator of HSP90 ATPase